MKNNATTETKQTFATRKIEACKTKFEEMKLKLVDQLAAQFPELRWQQVKQAVAEADAIARLTGLACLLLPTLAEEKVAKLGNWSSHKSVDEEVIAFAA